MRLPYERPPWPWWLWVAVLASMGISAWAFTRLGCALADVVPRVAG